MTWKTYLVMFFGTSDGKPSEIEKKIEKIGFTSTLGPVDFIYSWPEEPTKAKVLALADKVAQALKRTGSVFNIDTHE
jgi:hypothetical protein